MKKLFLLLAIVAMAGSALCQTRFSNNNRYGLKDAKGNVILKPSYDFIWDFEGKYAVMQKKDKKGLVNQEGIETIAPTYETLHKIKGYDLYYMSDKILNGVLSRYRLYGMITPMGKVLLEPIYFNSPSFKEPYHVAEVSNNYGYGMVDTTGKFIIPVNYTEINLKGDRAEVKKNNKTGLFNLKGEILIPMEYSRLYDFKNGLWGAMNGNDIEYYDNNGIKTTPHIYERGHLFQEGFAAVKRNGKYGFLDITGKEIIACQYDTVAAFVNGRSLVTHKGKQFYIDAPAKPQTTPATEYDSFSMISMDDVNALMKTLATYKKNFQTGPLSKMEDKALSPGTYEEARSASENTREVKRVTSNINNVKGESFEYYKDDKLAATLFFDEAKGFGYYHSMYAEEELRQANKSLKEASFTVLTTREDNGSSTDTWKKEGYAFSFIIQYVPGNTGAGIAIIANSFLKTSKVK